MAPSKILFSSLLSSLLLATLLEKVESQDTSFFINPFTPHSRRVIYEGDAYVPPDRPYVRLVPLRRPYSAGRVLYNTPVDLWATGTQASFDTNITLEMTPLFGDDFGFGFTFFIVPVNSTLPSGGLLNNLGIYDAVPQGTPIFAVEIDNGRGDFNPHYPHIGINIYNPRSQNHTRAEGMAGQRVSLRVMYDAHTNTINAVAMYGLSTATVSYVFNLAAILPQQVQVGISASTGVPTVTNLDAYTWQFVSRMVPDVIGTRKNDTLIKQYVM